MIHLPSGARHSILTTHSLTYTHAVARSLALSISLLLVYYNVASQCRERSILCSHKLTRALSLFLLFFFFVLFVTLLCTLLTSCTSLPCGSCISKANNKQLPPSPSRLHFLSLPSLHFVTRQLMFKYVNRSMSVFEYL